MKTLPLLVLSALVAIPVFAEDTRQLDAHEHGVGQLSMAIEGNKIAMELHAPGADIVGFEYAAASTEDLTAIDDALAVLGKPLEVFVFPAAAGCSVVEAEAELEGDDHDDHDEEGHDDHGDEDHDEGHEDHDDEDHEDHDDEDHDEDHEDHDEDHDEDHEGEEHDDHDHDAEEEGGHTEFHAAYLLECTDLTAVDDVTFAYFDLFPNAQEVEVQLISDQGSAVFEVERDGPILDLSGKL